MVIINFYNFTSPVSFLTIEKWLKITFAKGLLKNAIADPNI